VTAAWTSPADLGLPPESIQRQKSVGLWFEGDVLRVRAHLRDRYFEDDGEGELVLHEYRLEMWVDAPSTAITAIEVTPVHLPYGECFQAPDFVQRLVGLHLVGGFTRQAMRLLEGEAGCTHLNSLIADLAIAGLFNGYIRVREYSREHGFLPPMPPSSDKTGICTGWQRGGAAAEAMESGRGIAATHLYPLGDGTWASTPPPGIVPPPLSHGAADV
jgi:hypothetical protein